MSRLLVAVKSCGRDKLRGDHDVIRQTWGKDAKAAGIDVKFFTGASFARYESDEMHLNCQDDYHALPYKVREICKWASGKVLSHILLCDTDTFVNVERVLSSGFERYDYFGYFNSAMTGTFSYDARDRDQVDEHHERCYPWASGGYGYFLSKRALTEVAYEHPTSWAEDLWIGQVIGPKVEAGEMTIGNIRNMGLSEHFPSEKMHTNYNETVGHEWMRNLHKAK